MFSICSSSKLVKIGMALPLLLIFFLVADTAAQCTCKTKSVTRKKSAKRYTTARYVRPRRTVYRVPTNYPPVEYVETQPAAYKANGNGRVVVTERYSLIDDESDILYDVDYRETQRIARDYGRRDGWEDGEDAGMERDKYHPENSGDYRKATNGYEDTFGSKSIYRQAYRAAYLQGYRAGFRSVASREMLRAKNW